MKIHLGRRHCSFPQLCTFSPRFAAAYTFESIENNRFQSGPLLSSQKSQSRSNGGRRWEGGKEKNLFFREPVFLNSCSLSSSSSSLRRANILATRCVSIMIRHFYKETAQRPTKTPVITTQPQSDLICAKETIRDRLLIDI